MELVQLKYFVAIADTLSFTKAAASFPISQPALSYQIKRLEEELGSRLFERQGRKIALTPSGELLLPLAQNLLSRANEAVRVVRDQSDIEIGEVGMGGVPSVVTYLVPELLASFHQVFPRVRVDLVEAGDSNLQQRVFAGSLDFAIVSNPGSPQNLEVVPLGSEDLLVITSPAHRLAELPTTDLSGLWTEDFVLAETSYHLTGQITEACRRAGFEPNVAYQTGSLEATKNLVRAGLGVSIMPNMAVSGPGKTDLATIRVKGGLTRELYLIRGKAREMTRAAEVLMRHVRASVVEHMQYPPRGERPMPVAPGPVKPEPPCRKQGQGARAEASAPQLGPSRTPINISSSRP